MDYKAYRIGCTYLVCLVAVIINRIIRLILYIITKYSDLKEKTIDNVMGLLYASFKQKDGFRHY